MVRSPYQCVVLTELGVFTYLTIHRKSPYLLKVISMNAKTDLLELERLRAHYSAMCDVCRDMITQLRGDVPEKSAFTFSVGNLPVVKIPIVADNANFCVSIFISWYTYYSNQLKDITNTYNALATKVA